MARKIEQGGPQGHALTAQPIPEAEKKSPRPVQPKLQKYSADHLPTVFGEGGTPFFPQED